MSYATGKIIEDVLAANLRLTSTTSRTGWGHDVVTGQEAFTAEDWGVRNKWLWTPTLLDEDSACGRFHIHCAAKSASASIRFRDSSRRVATAIVRVKAE